MLTNKTYGELFAGIGGASLGLTNAGFQPTYAIDWNRGALDIFEANHSTPTVVHADIHSIDYTNLPPVDILWASPVCCNYSGANHNRGETVQDMRSGYSIIKAARQSQSLIIENVPAYFNSESYRTISELMQLDGMVYQQIYRLNAARYGNPASRDRTYAIFSRNFFKLDLPSETKTSWVNVLLANKQYWIESKLTKNQLKTIDADHSRPIPGSIYAIERCGYYKTPNIYNSTSAYPCIKSHSHHDGKNPNPGYGKIGSYRSYMDFIYEGQSYSVTPQLLGVLNGFPIDYEWGDNRAQAAAGCGNCVVPKMAEIVSTCLA